MANKIRGRATAGGTARYRNRFPAFPPESFRQRLGLSLSSIGLGTYLGEEDELTDKAYVEAVVLAVEQGCNVIDTAINYRCQRSERAIGYAVEALVEQGLVQRDELVICTKGGYLSFDGNLPDDPRRWVQETFIEPGVITWGDIVSSNVCHPAYMRHELERSLANLQVETIDVYYLHNPEAQFDGVNRDVFNRRMAACFEELENAVAEGKIGVYGTATWDGYRVSPDTRGYLSLSELESIARAVAGERHHFKAVQLPFNLAMPEAFTRENQTVGMDRVSTIAAADRLDVTVFGSAALLQARLTMLSRALQLAIPGFETDAQRSLQFARSAPGVTTALVGMKDPMHVSENLRVAEVDPLDADVFARVLATL